MNQQEQQKHYASNAKAQGHKPQCSLVVKAINWPTIGGRPQCSCGKDKRPPEEKVPMEGIDVIIHPDITPEQEKVAFQVLEDLFKEAGGKGGLRFVEIKQAESESE